MVDLQNLILVEMESRGIKKFKSVPFHIDITKPSVILDLNKYIYLFCSESVDIRPFTKVELISPDNYFNFCKTTLEKSTSSQFQFFTETMEIITSNFGKPADFIPYRLEFWKIIPE